jgi:hypothetical protein
MPTLVQHDVGHNQLHLIFDQDRIVASTVWINDYATIDLAFDGSPVGINIFEYYTAKRWPLEEWMVEKYSLGEHLDDLRLVWESFFAPPEYAVKAIKYEGPDGNEVIIAATDA